MYFPTGDTLAGALALRAGIFRIANSLVGDLCSEELLKSMLLEYERKWRDDGPCLLTIYERELSKLID